MDALASTPKFLTARELAERWRVTRQHIYKLKDDGVLPYYLLGESIRFLLHDIEGYETLARSQKG